ncbi:MAG: aminopeptidase [Deltaproteobacteria bacterium]|nr:aminopeptidase [Deltaproteobacteria bacterium]
MISDADIKAGGANVNSWLPAGEVYLTPVPGTVEGKLVDDRMIFEDKEITGITADIKAGKITSISAKTGWDAVKAIYDAAGPGKNDVGLLDFGINPAIKAGPKNESFVAAGIVTLGTGNNTWAGGTNKEPFGFQFFLTGATVTLDGKPLVEAGVLK